MSRNFHDSFSILVRHQHVTIVPLHCVLIASSLLAAWLLRFDCRIPLQTILVKSLPVLILFRVAALSRFGLLHRYWRHTGIVDLVNIGKAVGLGSLAFFVTIRYILREYEFAIPICILEAIVTAAALAGTRLCAVAIKNKRVGSSGIHKERRIIVAGAGDAASLLIREMLGTEFVPMACLDDDLDKHGAKIHGVPVVGTLDAIGITIRKYQAEELFIAIPSANNGQMQRVSRICEQAGVRYRTVPNLRELLMGGNAVSQLREVNVEDLLGRDPVQLDLRAVRNRIAGKVILVTGAAGSIGSELCRQILEYSPAKLIALDQAETPMFYLQVQLTKRAANERVVYKVANITHTLRMSRILREEGVHVIFHAAAYKHVGLVELNIRGALNNNVLALPPLLEVAEASGCEAFVLISSDKAVEPTSFMGATKRLGELLLAARKKENMRCVSVRFGNVLGSQGSVIPLFEKQINDEGRITITHPDVTRFFMTIPEAVSLVLQAFTMGDHGDILVLDMGKPVRILDLAHCLIRQSGKSPNQITIDIVGLRPGEKLHEHLFYPTERQLPTSNRKVKRTQSDIIPWPSLLTHLEDLQSLTNSGTEISIRAKMREIIPEYSYRTEYEHAHNVASETPLSAVPSVAVTFAAAAGQD
jgi:FlaA1/EpsC-like NDP-sugar epimerase